jgi:hypothetical protein
MNNLKRQIGVALFCCFCVYGISAQAIRDEAGTSAKAGEAAILPVTKISIFSSGLAYFEHAGTLNGQALVNLPFKENAVNDALMSLAINDPASANPSVSYQSEQTLIQTLRSLKIDLSYEPDMARIMSKLRGAEVEITVPSPVSGRILGVEYRARMDSQGGVTQEPWLSLSTEQGIKMFNFRDINSINFKDPQLSGDLTRALDLIAASRNSETRDLAVSLPGNGSRKVSLSYVIPAPVWTVSYRLDLGRDGGSKPLFQGWAIVDNDGDSDWKNVELSLVAGRPASFIQNLYPPYYLYRPTLPLAIAGTAAAVTHDTGFNTDAMKAAPAPAPSAARATARAEAMEAPMAMMDSAKGYSGNSLAGGVVETARAAEAGDQFEFTIKNPVSLDRRMSAMLPLVEAAIDARKLLIFSGANAGGRSSHPRLGAELTNTSGMKLPAGPITVYDGGTYAGDALIEFWNTDEKRLISFGEDLSVTGTTTDSSSRNMVSVTISLGVMTMNRSQEYTKTYTFKNSSAQNKNILIEHPKHYGAELVSPKADEQTSSAYRFTAAIPAGKELTVTVRETQPVMERVSLLQMRPDAFLSYASSQEIPARVKEALQRAVTLKTAVTAAETSVTEAERKRSGFISEQDRIRKNLEAAGSQTQQGQEYLKRLMSLDAEIDKNSGELETLRANAKNAQKAYEDYLNSLNL